MEYGELSAYPLHAGTVTGWVAGPLAGAEAALDPRPVSPQHADHVAGYDPGGHPDWIGTVFTIAQPYHAEAMRRALWSWHQRHETFRTTVGAEDCQRRTYAPEAVEVRAEVCATHPDADGVLAELLDFFETRVTPLTWPHLAVATVRPTSAIPTSSATAESGTASPWAGAAADREAHTGFLVVFGADHAVMDAYSQVLAIREIDDLYRQAYAGILADTAGSSPAASYVDFSVQEHQVATEDPPEETLRRWREFADRDGRLPACPRPRPYSVEMTPEPDRKTRQRGLCEWLVDLEEADEINLAARARGHSMANTSLAAICRALSCREAERFRFVMTMHTRTPEHLEAMGWYVGIAPVSVDLTGVRDVDDLIDRHAAATAHAKVDARVPYRTVAQRLGLQGGPRFVISYIDFRHVPGSEHFVDRGARVLRSAHHDCDEIYVWVIRSHAGIALSCRFPDDDESETLIRSLITGVRSGLREMGETAAPGAVVGR